MVLTLERLAANYLFALEQLRPFIHNCLLLKDLPQEIGENLLRRVEEEYKSASAAEQPSNAIAPLIEELNEELKKRGKNFSFPLLPQKVAVIEIQYYLIAFELYIVQCYRLNKLSLEQQNHFLSKATILWRDVGYALSLKETLVELCNLIAQVNGLIKDSKPYPTPPM